MSSHGRPKGESRRAQRLGTQPSVAFPRHPAKKACVHVTQAAS